MNPEGPIVIIAALLALPSFTLAVWWALKDYG